MSIIDEYNHAMGMVEEVERGPVSKFSAETRCYADLVRAVENYHRETQKRADRVQAELTKAKGTLAGIKSLRFGDGKQGWTLDYGQIHRVYEMAQNMENVSMVDTEAVMLAMADVGFAKVEDE